MEPKILQPLPTNVSPIEENKVGKSSVPSTRPDTKLDSEKILTSGVRQFRPKFSSPLSKGLWNLDD